MGAVILRRDYSVFPPLTHYLVREKEAVDQIGDKDWATSDIEAAVFLHEKAERIAELLRALFGAEHLYFHAAIREKPLPIRPVLDPDPAPVTEQPKIRRRRQKRARAIAARAEAAPAAAAETQQRIPDGRERLKLLRKSLDRVTTKEASQMPTWYREGQYA